MTKEEFLKNHLNYYLALENNFKNTFQFVSSEKDNYKTYSNEYLKLIFLLGSEIYVVQDLVASFYDPDYESHNLKDYEVIENNITNLKLLEVEFKENRDVFKPFDASGYPDWKKVYNKNKHKRLDNAMRDLNDTRDTHDYSNFDANKKWYQYANLEYVIQMFTVLHSLEMIGYKKLVEDDNIKNSKNNTIVPTIKSLFRIKNLDWEHIVYSDGLVIDKGNLILSNY